MRILIAEDTASLYAQILRGLGHDVAVARSMAEATAAFGGGPCDLVVADAQDAERDAERLLSEARRRGCVRGVAVLGLCGAADVERCLAAGFDSHLHKPVEFRQLLAAVLGRSPDR